MTFDLKYLIGLFSYTPFWEATMLVAVLSVLSWSIGSVLGFGVALAKTSNNAFLRHTSSVYVWFFRSLPLLVLLIFVYNLPQILPSLRPVLSNPFWAGLIALVMSETAYLAEIHRGGLLAVRKGQHEAALALGIRSLGKYRLIVIPQAVRVALPALGNEFITIVKLTSLVSVISLAEILLVGQRLYTRNFLVIETLVAVSFYYVLLVTVFTQILGRLERSMDIRSKSGVETVAEAQPAALPVVSSERKRKGAKGDLVLELRDVTKSFGEKTVLDGISFKVKAGEVVSVIGPSGSGKTTLIRTINSLQDIDGGAILFNGNRWLDNHGEYWRSPDFYEEVTRIGMVFQSFNLFPHRTVLENVAMAPRYHGLGSSRALKELALRNLEKVGMACHADKYPHQLSGGQKQRIAIARALAMQPKVLLFDEPTSALDPELVGEVLQTIELLAHEGMTMIIVTHEMRFATRISDRVVMMEDGKMVADLTPEQLADEPDDSRIRRFIETALH